MLSYGAGAWLLQNHPNATGISLKIEEIELIYHANADPVCMYSGLAHETSTKSWLDYSSYLDAATAGVFDLLQNIRLLDNVMKLAVEG
jgi:3-oxoacyl-[acyl-carrier-protein] synthase-3